MKKSLYVLGLFLAAFLLVLGMKAAAYSQYLNSLPVVSSSGVTVVVKKKVKRHQFKRRKKMSCNCKTGESCLYHNMTIQTQCGICGIVLIERADFEIGYCGYCQKHIRSGETARKAATAAHAKTWWVSYSEGKFSERKKVSIQAVDVLGVLEYIVGNLDSERIVSLHIEETEG